MTEEQPEPTPPIDPTPAPVSLRGYYAGSLSLPNLFKAASLESVPPGLWAELDTLDPEFKKTAALAVAAGERRGAVTPEIVSWLRAGIEAEFGQPLDAADLRSGLGLRRLFGRYRADAHARTPRLRQRALNRLRVALAVVRGMHSLDAVELARETQRLWFPEERTQPRNSDIERSAVSLLMRAGTPPAARRLMTALRLWTLRTEQAQLVAAQAREERDAALSRAEAARNAAQLLEEKLHAVQLEVSTLAGAVQRLTSELESANNRRVNELRALKGRLLNFFVSGIRPRLRTVHDAVKVEPVVPAVAVERLTAIAELLDREEAWLSSD